MRRKMFIGSCIIIMLVSICGCFEGLAARGRIIDVRNNFKLQNYDNSLTLDYSISSIAVDSRGNVAVQSGSSASDLGRILSIYSPEGEFLYGYKMQIRNGKGRVLFYYDIDDKLCCCFAYASDEKDVLTQNVELVFEHDSLEYTAYDLEYARKKILWGRAKEYGDGFKPINVTVSPYGHFSTAYCTEATYALRNNKTHEITPIYDWLEEYEEAERERAKRRLSMLPFFIILPFLAVLLICWGRKNTISAQEQARRQQMKQEDSSDDMNN